MGDRVFSLQRVRRICRRRDVESPTGPGAVLLSAAILHGTDYPNVKFSSDKLEQGLDGVRGPLPSEGYRSSRLPLEVLNRKQTISNNGFHGSTVTSFRDRFGPFCHRVESRLPHDRARRCTSATPATSAPACCPEVHSDATGPRRHAAPPGSSPPWPRSRAIP